MKKDMHKTALEKKLEAELSADKDAAEAAPAQAGEAAADTAQEGAALAKELEARTAERDELDDQLLRARAEFDNFRKRTQRDIERIRKTAAEALIRELLPVLDNLERAREHANEMSGGLAEGVELVLSQFHEVLTGQGLAPIPALGETFDPKVHEALAQLPSGEYPADTVMEEYERGYRLGDYVLRVAKVVVSSGPPQQETAKTREEQAAGTEQGPRPEVAAQTESE